MSAGEPALRATSAGVTKIPDPTIPPITIIVPSKRPMRRAKPAAGTRGPYHGPDGRPQALRAGAGAGNTCRARGGSTFFGFERIPRVRSDRMPARQGSILIENVQPQIDCGRHPVKRVAGETVRVTADVLKEGHDELAVVLRWRKLGPQP